METNDILQKQKIDAEEKTKTQLLLCIPLFFLAFTIPVVAYTGFAIPQTESLDTWFQRSGSLTVLFSVWAEYNLMKVSNLQELSLATWGGTNLPIETKYKNIHTKANYLAILFAISGTFIWGYGDLLV